MLNIKKLIETAEDMPEEVRRNALLLLEAIEEGDVVERIAADFVRGAMRQLREELSVGKSTEKARNIES